MNCCSACAQGRACSGARNNPRRSSSVVEHAYEIGRDGRRWTVDTVARVAGRFEGRTSSLHTWPTRAEAIKAARAQGRKDLSAGICGSATIQGPNEETLEVISMARSNPDKKPSAASQVPKGEIDFIVGRYHVGTPVEEVAENIRVRCQKAGVPAPVAKACVAYAQKAHLRNRDLYEDVMLGRTSRRRRSSR